MSWRARVMGFLLRRMRGREPIPIPSIRKSLNRLVARFGPRVPKSLRVNPLMVAGVPCLWVTQKKSKPHNALLYLHGGGYCFGSPKTHRALVCALAKQLSCNVLAPDYRLAPEHPFPAALQDVQIAWQWLTERYDSEYCAIGGDSAGGGLVFALACSSRDASLALPSALFAFSPWTDLTLSGRSMDENAKKDVMVSPRDLLRMGDFYSGDQNKAHPSISPLFGDLSSLPKVLIQVSDVEVLRDDSFRMAKALQDVGGEVKLEIWPGLMHVWPAFVGFVPEAKKSIKAVAAFLHEAWPSSGKSE